MVPILLMVIVIVVVGVGVLAYRNRSDKGIESGITSFRRELRALAPTSDQSDHAATANPSANPTADPTSDDEQGQEPEPTDDERRDP